MKAHPYASMAYRASMRDITHQLLILRVWWLGGKREICVWTWKNARSDPDESQGGSKNQLSNSL